MVQKDRDDGKSLETACEKVADITHPRIGSDAVRRIYENETKKKGGAALVQISSTWESQGGISDRRSIMIAKPLPCPTRLSTSVDSCSENRK